MKTHVQIDEKTNIPLGFILTIVGLVAAYIAYGEAHFAKASEVVGMQAEIHQIYEKLIPEAARPTR